MTHNEVLCAANGSVGAGGRRGGGEGGKGSMGGGGGFENEGRDGNKSRLLHVSREKYDSISAKGSQVLTLDQINGGWGGDSK